MFAALFVGGTIWGEAAWADQDWQPSATETGIYYEVRKGDTLWDLSDRFYNSPWEWPGLWEANQHIANPHWIYPGDPIRLYQRKGGDLLTGGAGQPLEPPTLRYPFIDHIGFVRKDPLPSSGHIIQFRRQGNIKASEGDVVFVKDNGETPLEKGGHYHVYRTYGPVRDPQTRRVIGDQYYFTGQLEIFQLEEKFYRARLTESYRGVEVGDLLIPYTPRNARFTISGTPPDIDGTILLNEERQEAFGQFDVVYLDKGADDLIAPGQTYRIYYNRTSEDITVDLDVGELLVLMTEKNTATGVVLSSAEDLYAGYRFRSLRP